MLLDTDIYCAQVLREIIPGVAQVQNGTNNKFRIISWYQIPLVIKIVLTMLPSEIDWDLSVNFWYKKCKIVLTMCHILTMHHYSNSCILYTWCPKQTMVMARCGQGWGWSGAAVWCNQIVPTFNNSLVPLSPPAAAHYTAHYALGDGARCAPDNGKLSQDNNAKRVTRSSQLTPARVRRSAELSDAHKSDAMSFMTITSNNLMSPKTHSLWR